MKRLLLFTSFAIFVTKAQCRVSLLATATVGTTIASLNAHGNDKLIRYDEASGGSVLSRTMLVVNGAKYYMSQDNDIYTSSRPPMSVNIAVPVPENVLHNKGGVLYINSNATVFVSGGLENDINSQLINNGTLAVGGDITNDQTMNTANKGTLRFNGNIAQAVNGSAPYLVTNVVLDNAAGITLNTPLKAEGEVTFLNGIIHADDADKPLIFTSNGSANNASDASHVHGYVVKEGLGSFTYPVGDGVKYQPIAANFTLNSNGVRARYHPSDAGIAPFATSGTVSIALDTYNSAEYWDLSPLSNATGKVTLFWDGYNNPLITKSGNINVFKLAHKTSGVWQNEGGTASGTLNAGSITGNSLSTWSPLALGAISQSALPVTLASFDAIKKENAALLFWSTTLEINSERFDVQRSANGMNWETLTSIAAIANSRVIKNYSFTDSEPLKGENLYRLKMIDLDGSYGYSRLQNLNFEGVQSFTAFPNPARDMTQIQISKQYVGTEAQLVNSSGIVVRKLIINNETFALDLAPYSPGLYLLKTGDNKVIKILKQ